MNYTIVKQFYNSAVDNIFKFFFKIVDFFKILYEALWAFFEIWAAFYLIFYNFFMYMYYIILYAIDRGADESRSTVIFWKRLPKRVSSAPSVILSNEPNPIPAMYGRQLSMAAGKVASATMSTLDSTISSTKAYISTSASGGKVSILKKIVNGLSGFFSSLIKIFIKPAETFSNFFNRKLKPVREDDENKEQKNKSLIDEYMKEYARKRK